MPKRIITLSIVCFSFFIACVGQKLEIGNKEIKAIKLTWSIPIVEASTGKVGGIKDSCLIYCFDDLILYRFPYQYKKFNANVFSADTNRLTDDPRSIDKTEIWFENFIYRINAPTGYRYDSLAVKSYRIFDVDSLLKSRVFKGANFYDVENDKLIETIKAKDGTRIEKYIPKIKSDESYSDTTYLRYANGFKKIEYSLSKKADSIKKMKLVEVRLIYNGIPKENSKKVDIPRREFIFKISEVKVENETEILAFFEKFKKDCKSLNLH